MAVPEQKQKDYEKIVDVINTLMVAVGDLFDNPKAGPLGACIFEARRGLDLAFLYTMKGMNIQDSMSPEAIQKVIDNATKDGLHVIQKEPK